MKTLFTISKQVQAPYLARARIFLLLRWRRRVLFFFHFQRILAVLFLNGCCLDIFNSFGEYCVDGPLIDFGVVSVNVWSDPMKLCG